jgi:hypothetical protein
LIIIIITAIIIIHRKSTAKGWSAKGKHRGHVAAPLLLV